MWAVLPAKDFRNAKKRLSPALSPQERQSLFAIMLEDVLEAAVNAPSLDGVMVVTRDPQAASLARKYNVEVNNEPSNDGQSAAVARAAYQLSQSRRNGILTLPGDTPNLRSSEIEAIIAKHPPAPAMSIVPSHDKLGSNCIALTPPNLIPFHFGHESFQPHLDEATKRHIDPVVHLDLPGIGLDIDTPADLVRFLREDGETRTHKYLRESGIAKNFLSKQNMPGTA